jgi:hypothetical protein
MDPHVRIDMDSIFGVCGLHTSWMGFGAQAVDLDKPFTSETSFRSFLGAGGALRPGFTPDRFAAAIIEAYVAKDCRGKLVRVPPKWRRRS